ncbi:hypothetical protein ACFQU1_01215 [Chelatococcus sp. GCM10030263]
MAATFDPRVFPEFFRQIIQMWAKYRQPVAVLSLGRCDGGKRKFS